MIPRLLFWLWEPDQYNCNMVDNKKRNASLSYSWIRPELCCCGPFGTSSLLLFFYNFYNFVFRALENDLGLMFTWLNWLVLLVSLFWTEYVACWSRFPCSGVEKWWSGVEILQSHPRTFWDWQHSSGVMEFVVRPYGLGLTLWGIACHFFMSYFSLEINLWLSWCSDT